MTEWSPSVHRNLSRNLNTRGDPRNRRNKIGLSVTPNRIQDTKLKKRPNRNQRTVIETNRTERFTKQIHNYHGEDARTMPTCQPQLQRRTCNIFRTYCRTTVGSTDSPMRDRLDNIERRLVSRWLKRSSIESILLKLCDSYRIFNTHVIRTGFLRAPIFGSLKTLFTAYLRHWPNCKSVHLQRTGDLR